MTKKKKQEGEKIDPQDKEFKTQQERLAELSSSREHTDRAAEILNQMNAKKKGRSKNMIKRVKKDSKRSKITQFGREKLAAGPQIFNSKNIILVEGRADVMNLLKMGIENTIAIEGTNVSRTITNLCRKRTVTALLDGDRGGDSILKELLLKAKIEYVARAPVGKEVENLDMKEVTTALEKYKIPVVEAQFVDDTISVKDFLRYNKRYNYLN